MSSTVRLSALLLFLLTAWSCGSNPERAGNDPSGDFSSHDATRSYFQWTDNAPRLISAHRGGPYPGYPENSIEAFENVLKYTNAIIECDVAITKDDYLIMMHDDKLDRTTTGTGLVRDKTLNEIKGLYLKDLNDKVTAYKVPTLEEVLEWSEGRVFLTLDIKRGVPIKKVNDLILKTKTGPNVAIITYTIKKAREVHDLNPDLMLSVTARSMDDVERLKDSGIDPKNLIAFTGVSEPDSKVYESLHRMGVYTILGALGNLDRRAMARGDEFYLQLYENGADIMATDRPVEVAEILRRSEFSEQN